MRSLAAETVSRATCRGPPSVPVTPLEELNVTVNWRHRIIRVPLGDVDEQQDAVLRAISEGWILTAQEHGDGGSVDLVFRRAQARRPRVAWS